MTDINKTIMEKSQGGLKLNPDEQRKFLGTFEERVVAECSIDGLIVLLSTTTLKKCYKRLSWTISL